MRKQGIFVVVLMLIAVSIWPTCIWATAIDEPTSGSFMIRASNDEPYNPALLLKSDVDIEISGLIANVIVNQYFYNVSERFMEGQYVFPLPENAAVNAMTIQMGERVIRGEIHEKAQAQAIYTEAKQQGRRAGLVSQNRTNLFTTTLANISPHEVIKVQIRYIQNIEQASMVQEIVFPMTITPRYAPIATLDIQEDEQVNTIIKNLDSKVDSRFAYSDTLPREMANPIHINIKVNGADSIEHIESQSHAIETKRENQTMYVTTKAEQVPMDRDFHLKWQFKRTAQSDAYVYLNAVDGEYYATLMVIPPVDLSPTDHLKRDVIFIIDTSGSMGGESLRQAKASLEIAINKLSTQHKFNIIEFNDMTHRFFHESIDATPQNKQQAIAMITKLEATGGTEMAPALKDAFSMPLYPEYLRQIIFITDGAVFNENELFSLINHHLGDSRLFTVGIGSSPNRMFMKKAAQFGRGSAVMISDYNEVGTKIAQLFAKLENPVMRDITLAVDDNDIEMYPTNIPDLYLGEPIQVAVRFKHQPTSIRILGSGSQPWSRTLHVDASVLSRGIETLWARQKIESLTDQMLQNKNVDTLKAEITAIALKHHLVSQYTSFVAVDEQVSRPKSAQPGHEQVMNLMPAGATMGRSYGMPSTANGIALWLLAGFILILGAVVLSIQKWKRQ